MAPCHPPQIKHGWQVGVGKVGGESAAQYFPGSLSDCSDPQRCLGSAGQQGRGYTSCEGVAGAADTHHSCGAALAGPSQAETWAATEQVPRKGQGRRRTQEA